tara:strand:- start:308 stop:793 length:486 start_codon:yes stop_codon:yes gene_type:complete
MAITTFGLGPYTGTHNGNDFGLCEGPKLIETTSHQQEIRADITGDSIVDTVYRGGDVLLLITFKSWIAETRNIFWPWGAMGAMGLCGRLGTDEAHQIVLTVVPNTPAAANGFATITFPKCIIAPETAIVTPHGTVEQNVPIAFRVFPTGSLPASQVWYTTT